MTGLPPQIVQHSGLIAKGDNSEVRRRLGAFQSGKVSRVLIRLSGLYGSERGGRRDRRGLILALRHPATVRAWKVALGRSYHLLSSSDPKHGFRKSADCFRFVLKNGSRLGYVLYRDDPGRDDLRYRSDYVREYWGLEIERLYRSAIAQALAR